MHPLEKKENAPSPSKCLALAHLNPSFRPLNSSDSIRERFENISRLYSSYILKNEFMLPFLPMVGLYQNTFTELAPLSKGGFGVVFKARHLLDGSLYAIKKIFLSEGPVPPLEGVNAKYRKIIREVEILSKLEHPNVMRYHSAWIELEPAGHQCNFTDEDDTPPSEGASQNDTTQINGLLPIINFQDIPVISVQDPTPPKISEISSSNEPCTPENSHSKISTHSDWYDFSRTESFKTNTPPPISLVYITEPTQSEENIKNWNSGKSTISNSGKSINSNSGKSTISNSGKSNLSNSGKSTMNNSGKSNLNNSGKSTINNSGKSTMNNTGKSNLNTSGKSSFSNSGKSKNGKSKSGDFRSGNFINGKSKISPGRSPQKEIFSVPFLELKPNLILYIKTQLYSGSTLGDWLRFGRTAIDVKHNFILFEQICLGLQYIHGKGLLHRDIKPDNIFLAEDGMAKIGDFGLARGIFEGEDKTVEGGHQHTPLSKSRGHTSGLGTATYAAPEQMTTTGYSQKVDIYSLGIILFEMHHIFNSRHERAQLISQLKKGNLPPDFQKQFPNQGRLILAMTSTFPDSRPSAQDLCQICCTLGSPKIDPDLSEPKKEINIIDTKLETGGKLEILPVLVNSSFSKTIGNIPEPIDVLSLLEVVEKLQQQVKQQAGEIDRLKIENILLKEQLSKNIN